MIVEILTLEEILLSKEVKSVIVPGKSGDFEMLDNHAPIISILKKGTVKVTDINNDIREQHRFDCVVPILGYQFMWIGGDIN